MNNMVKKNDSKFLFCLCLLGLACGSRFFDHVLIFHSAPMGIMQNYHFNMVISAIYYICMLAFFAVCIKKTDEKDKKIMYYLVTFFAIFAGTIYLPAQYFGSMETYSWILTFIMIILIILGRGEWLIIPLSMAAACISPMSTITCGVVIFMLILYKYIETRHNKYLLLELFVFVISMAGILISRKMNYFQTDVQCVISSKKFIVTMILIIPYILAAVQFFKRVISKANGVRTKYFLLLIIAISPAIAIYTYFQDYLRMIFYSFEYFTVMVITMFVMKDITIVSAVIESKNQIRKKIMVPAVFIAYAFIFITLWYIGPLELIEETVLGN